MSKTCNTITKTLNKIKIKLENSKIKKRIQNMNLNDKLLYIITLY